jgi:hypothetical protein
MPKSSMKTSKKQWKYSTIKTKKAAQLGCFFVFTKMLRNFNYEKQSKAKQFKTNRVNYFSTYCLLKKALYLAA